MVDILRGEGSEVADPLWRRVIARSRAGEPIWTVIAAGAVLPRLVISRTRLVRGWGISAADAEAEMLTALLHELRTMDTSIAGVGSHLWFQAVRAGTRYRDHARREAQRHTGGWSDDLLPRQHPYGAARGVVSVLAEAISDGVITPRESEVIARTRLERESLQRVAGDLGLAYITARRMRRAAERRLARSLDKKSWILMSANAA